MILSLRGLGKENCSFKTGEHLEPKKKETKPQIHKDLPDVSGS